MRKKILAGIITISIGVFCAWPSQEFETTVTLKHPVVASETPDAIFVKTDESPWVKPEPPVALSDDIQLTEEDLATQIQMEVKSSYFEYLDKQNNIFGRTILGGYCLSSQHNAQIAANIINNIIIQPQEVFSFNTVAGPYVADKGYGMGTIIVNSRFVPGMGGGVCRASTALYNAALGSELDIIESHRHSLPVGYAKPGKDAAVSYGAIDLKIRNNRSYPIQIITKEEGGIIYVAFIELNTENSTEVQENRIKNDATLSDEVNLEESI